jgi:acetyl/propionyl-CoA carboxylase alpha subunit
MTGYQVLVDGEAADPGEWHVEWDDRERGIARLVAGQRSIPVLVEGQGTEWFVTIRGRRIPVTVRTWRERLLAEAESSAQAHAGPTTVKATLPGLIVAVAVTVGDQVEQGAALLTIEAMKMQNEVRAPRPGRVVEITVAAGVAVATGAPLLRLE